MSNAERLCLIVNGYLMKETVVLIFIMFDLKIKAASDYKTLEFTDIRVIAALLFAFKQLILRFNTKLLLCFQLHQERLGATRSERH